MRLFLAETRSLGASMKPENWSEYFQSIKLKGKWIKGLMMKLVGLCWMNRCKGKNDKEQKAEESDHGGRGRNYAIPSHNVSRRNAAAVIP
jgi:hypothetical protein